jgi:outer membrane protein TolC
MFSFAEQNVIKKLTIDTAYEICKTNNLNFQQQLKQIEKAKAAYNIQKANFYPSFTINGSFNYVSDLAKLELPQFVPGISQQTIEAGVKDQYDLNAAIKQPIFTGFRSKNLVNSALEDIEIAKFQQKIVTNNILLQIRLIYYSAYLIILQQKVLETSSKRIHQHLLTMKNLFYSGQVLPYDTIKVSNQLLGIETKRAKLKNSFKIALSQLALILNVLEIQDIEQIDLEKVVVSIPDKEDLIEKAFQRRPELLQLYHQNQSLKYQKNAIKGGLFPQIFAQASYHYARPGVNFFKDKWMDYYTFGVGLHWELWHKSQTKNKILKANQSIDVIELSKSDMVAKIRHGINQTYENLISDKEQIELSKYLVSQEKEGYRITRENYEQGQATTTDLLDAETTLTTAELLLQQNLIGWLVNKAKLDHAIGEI